jgi:MFS family permease
MRIFFGFVLDRFGPKVAAGFTNLLCVIGLGLFITDSPDVLQDRIMAAWVLLSAGGGGLHVSGFHAKNVYPTKELRGVKSAGISAAFGASSLVFLAWLVMSDLGASFAVMAGINTAIAVALLFVNIRCQPWRAGKPGECVDIRKQTLFGGSTEEVDRRKVLTRQPSRWDDFGTVLRKMVLTKKYLLLIFWFSCNLLLQTHYLSSIFYTLYKLGDASLTMQYYKTNLKISDWRDYMFFKAASICNGCGFLWFPLVQRTMTYLNWSTRFGLVILTQTIMVALLSFVEKLEVQFATFLLQGLSRLMLFTYYHAFIADQFGMKQFGKLVGIGTLAASLVGLLSYPLQLMMTYDFGGDYSMSYLFIGAGVLMSAALPIWLRIQERADAVKAAADAAAADATMNKSNEAPAIVTGVVASGDDVGMGATEKEGVAASRRRTVVFDADDDSSYSSSFGLKTPSQPHPRA